MCDGNEVWVCDYTVTIEQSHLFIHSFIHIFFVVIVVVVLVVHLLDFDFRFYSFVDCTFLFAVNRFPWHSLRILFQHFLFFFFFFFHFDFLLFVNVSVHCAVCIDFSIIKLKMKELFYRNWINKTTTTKPISVYHVQIHVSWIVAHINFRQFHQTLILEHRQRIHAITWMEWWRWRAGEKKGTMWEANKKKMTLEIGRAIHGLWFQIAHLHNDLINAWLPCVDNEGYMMLCKIECRHWYSLCVVIFYMHRANILTANRKQNITEKHRA